MKPDFENNLVIFTDGASSGNPGPGGWGAVLLYKTLDEVVELGGSKPKTTNNEMELSAVAGALSHALMSTSPIDVVTDSSYVVHGATKWMFGWKENGWKRKVQNKSEPLSNEMLWKTIYDLVTKRDPRAPVRFFHIAGHAGIPGNERCDEIATGLCTGKPTELYRGKYSSYPIKLEHMTPDTTMLEQKKSKNTGKAFSYVSYVDGKIAVHGTWSECEARVRGKQARYAKALSPQHEAELIDLFQSGK